MIQDMHLIRQIRMVQEYAYRLVMKSMKQKGYSDTAASDVIVKDKALFFRIDRRLRVYLY